MWFALVQGAVLGFVGGIPVGPVNAAVIDTSLRKCFRRAFAVGVGGAFVDFIYSQLAIAGLGPLMDRVPGLATALLGIGGIVLVIFGVMTVQAPPPERAEQSEPVLARALVAAFFSGVLITLANPAALVSWVLLAGTFLADFRGWTAVSAGIGIFVGTCVWFLIIAYLASKGRVRLGRRSQWVTRLVGALLVVYGVFLVGKASAQVWASTLTR
jgi:threonine/homoserine/homoserine lactone efflux protein